MDFGTVQDNYSLSEVTVVLVLVVTVIQYVSHGKLQSFKALDFRPENLAQLNVYQLVQKEISS